LGGKKLVGEEIDEEKVGAGEGKIHSLHVHHTNSTQMAALKHFYAKFAVQSSAAWLPAP